MTDQIAETQWYIARDGKQHGPLTDIEMRTFVAHSYLRPVDLIWRPGMAEWLPAPQVFPAVFQGAAPALAPAPVQAVAPAPATATVPGAKTAHTSDFDANGPEAASAGRGMGRKLAIAAASITLIAGGAYAAVTYREPLMQMISGGAVSSTTAKPVEVASTAPVVSAPAAENEPAPAAAQIDTKSADPALPAATAVQTTSPATEPAAATAAPAQETQTAALSPPEPPAAPAAPPSIEGSAIDARLQKVPLWAQLKKEYPDWYIGNVAAAEKLVTDKKSQSDVATQLAQGLATLRRQNAEKALAANCVATSL